MNENKDPEGEVEFDSKEFIQTSSKILKENVLPQNIMMSIVSNTPMGINLFMVGLAREQVTEVQNLLDVMSTLEAEIFKPEEIKKLSQWDKVNYYKLAKESFKFRIDFIKDVQENTDWPKLQGEILELGRKEEEAMVSDSNLSTEVKDVKSILKNIIQRDFSLNNDRKSDSKEA